MKNTNTKKTKRIASALAALSLVSAMAMPVATISASAAEATAIVEEVSIPDGEIQLFDEIQLDVEAEDKDEKPSYNGHEIIDGKYHHEGNDFTFKYSDGFFEVDPNKYDAHLATMSASIAHASCTEIGKGNDYSIGAKKVVDILNQAGFEEKDIYVSDSYRVKPTPDSVACVIATKDIKTQKGDKKLVSITVRSAGYEAEWASNVTLGTEGEAAGFANAASQVMDYFDDFNSDGKLDEALADGDVIFWVHGYSRGGATANLTSKRLIDRYQDGGNEVYGYCIEAPQGGVQDVEYFTRNYQTIHNVINPDDLVPYVAPTAMGFKRYGVDHFMFGGDAKEGIHGYSGLFSNTMADNSDTKTIDMKAQTERMIRQIENIAPGKTDKYKPFDMEVEGAADLGHFMNDLLNQLAAGAGRDTYSAELQGPARRMISFLVANDGITIEEKDAKALVTELQFAALRHGGWTAAHAAFGAVAAGINRIKSLIKGTDDFIPVNNKVVCSYIGQLIAEALERTDIINKFDEYPSDGTLSSRETLKNDIITVLANISTKKSISISFVKKLINFAPKVEKIFDNHQFIQTMSWLRSFDSWYDDISEGITDGATGTWDNDVSEGRTGGATGQW